MKRKDDRKSETVRQAHPGHALAVVWYRPIASADGIFAHEVMVEGDRAALGESPARELRALVAAATSPDRPLFLNLDPGDLQDQHLYDASAPLGQVARWVVLQLREHPPAGEDGMLDARISRLRQLGFRLCASDFGAEDGAVSSAPVIWPDFIRLSGPLVENAHLSRGLQAVVRDLCSLYRQSQMTVIAEGITTAVQAATLRELGCALLQGPLFDGESGR